MSPYSTPVFPPLLQSPDLLQFLHDSMDQGVLVFDADTGALLLTNPALARLLGYTHTELQALTAAALVPDLLRPSPHALFKSMARGETRHGRLQLRRKDGSLLGLDFSTTLLQVAGKPCSVLLLSDRSESERAELAEAQARHDGLTGLYNHRAFQELLEQELARAQRYGTALSLLMLDIDHFKRINDSLGHQAGDAVLQQLGGLLRDSARNIDHVCRYGGEEFALILPMSSTTEALQAAERLRSEVERFEFACGHGNYRTLTVSAGVASYPAHAQTQAALIAAADAAMYAAKRAGRNCCQAAG